MRSNIIDSMMMGQRITMKCCRINETKFSNLKQNCTRLFIIIKFKKSILGSILGVLS